MSNFLNGLIKFFGFSDGGLAALICSIYVKRTKKLSYVEEKAIKEEHKEQLINIRLLCFILYFIISLSLFLTLNFTKFNNILIWSIHIIFYLCVFIYKIIKESQFYK